MRKIWYVSSEKIDTTGSLGVAKKIKSQIRAMQTQKMNCEYYYFPYMYNNNIFTKIKRRLWLFNIHKHWQIDNRLKEAHGLYIRYMGTIDQYVIQFLNRFRKVNPNCKIVLELMTYPYDGEVKRHWYDYSLYWIDRHYRKQLFKYIDRIATLTLDDSIWGIPTLKINNGIDFSINEVRSGNLEKNCVHVIAVSICAWWHAYERFIEGLHNYYTNGGNRNIVFHLVGDGTELPKYRELTAKYELDSHVIFHGMQSGGALDEIYGQCTLGIASLGFYRSGLSEGAPLKTREYLAKGIPFIFSAKVSDIDSADEKDIYLRVPNNDSSIDIPSVLAFYDRIYQEPETQVIARLRKYAEDHFSMDAAMKEVIDYFKSEEV